jgi:hypothetical protein
MMFLRADQLLDTAPDVFSTLDIVGSTRDAARAEYLANHTGKFDPIPFAGTVAP